MQVLMAQVLGPSRTHAAGNKLHQILCVTKNSKTKTTRSLRDLISKNLLQHTTPASLGVSPGLPALSSPSKLLVWARALPYIRAQVLHRAWIPTDCKGLVYTHMPAVIVWMGGF